MKKLNRGHNDFGFFIRLARGYGAKRDLDLDTRQTEPDRSSRGKAKKIKFMAAVAPNQR